MVDFFFRFVLYRKALELWSNRWQFSWENELSIKISVECYSQEFYPVNYLRNTAMAYVSSAYIFQLDIDFLPQFGLYESLKNHIANLKIRVSDKIALIVPAFETQRYR